MNPDPSRMVPSLAIGFDDLDRRTKAQRTQAQLHLEKLQVRNFLSTFIVFFPRVRTLLNILSARLMYIKEISTRLSSVARQHSLTTSARLHKLKTNQGALTSRLVSLATRIPSSSATTSISTQSAEETLCDRTRALRERLQATGGRARLGELWAGLAHLRIGRGEDGKWTITDEREIKKVLEVYDVLSLLLLREKGNQELMWIFDVSFRSW